VADNILTPELLNEVYSSLKTYIEEHYAPGEARYFFLKSRKKILPYFQQLEQITVDDEGQVHLSAQQLDDGLTLAFAVWMQQFIKELHSELIGFPLPDIEALTEAHRQPLEAAGFYEFFRQASELEYE